MDATAPALGVERKDGCWYARDAHALLAHPGIPADLRAELAAWVAHPDVNVRSRRPLVVTSDAMYSFDGRYRAAHGAPTWWAAAWAEWAAATGG